MNSYTSIAHLYDNYVVMDLDIPLFVEALDGADAVLELMAGTGRVSEVLVEAHPNVTCVDRSAAMLSVFRKKPKLAGMPAICADVCELPLGPNYDLVVLPFNSFAELTNREDQVRALAEVARVLRPDGRFICTLHNPAVRRQTLDGEARQIGRFRTDRGDWTVTATGSARGSLAESAQVYVCRDGHGRVVERLEQTVQFALIERKEFEEMAMAAGLVVESTRGDYEEGVVSDSSPFLIWSLRRGRRAV